MTEAIKKDTSKGLRIIKVPMSSPAYTAGLRKHDIILSVNDEPVEDDLDFSFHSACEYMEIRVLRKNVPKTFHITRKPGKLLGIEFSAHPVSRCRNKCIFCFIDQLPDGLRRNLYVKDEDCRYSFLNGNYVTLTSITKSEIDKVIRLRLSPLYVSVHATDPEVRIKMLNNRKAGRIMEQLGSLANSDIAFHAQIVVCPDINDGDILQKTIKDLLSFQNALLSIAVVPVGLTNHRKKHLKPVLSKQARAICKITDVLSKKDKNKIGKRRVFVADELFIKAGLPVPGDGYYEDYPQIENGVGLIRLLLDEWKLCKKELSAGDSRKKKSVRRKQYCIITSVSAHPFIQEIVEELSQHFPLCDMSILPVYNRFFGESVTVAGLITARDIIKTVRMTNRQWDTVVLPEVLLNYRKYTLDGYSIKRMGAALSTRTVSVEGISQLVALLQKRNHAG